LTKPFEVVAPKAQKWLVCGGEGVRTPGKKENGPEGGGKEKGRSTVHRRLKNRVRSPREGDTSDIGGREERKG